MPNGENMGDSTLPIVERLRLPLCIEYAVPIPVTDALQRAADERGEAADTIEALYEAAGFLCARVRELEGEFTDDDTKETTAQFFGHVLPAVARMEGALAGARGNRVPHE